MDEWKGTREEVKRLLRRYAGLCGEREWLKERLAQIDAERVGIQAVPMDGMPRSSSVGKPTERTAIQHSSLREQYEKRLEESERAEAELDKMLSVLKSKERMIIRSRYIDGLSWRDVAYDNCCSIATAKRLHNLALDRIMSHFEPF